MGIKHKQMGSKKKQEMEDKINAIIAKSDGEKILELSRRSLLYRGVAGIETYKSSINVMSTDRVEEILGDMSKT